MRYVKFLSGFISASCTLVLVSCKSDAGSAVNPGSSASVADAAQNPKSAESSEPIRAGVEPPEFTLPDLNGKNVSLKDFRGKAVLLNFWATWCVPCVAEMAALQRLSQVLAEKNLVVVGINVDDDSHDKEVTDFIRDKGLTFPILRDKTLSIPELFTVSGFPETFLIGPDGKFLLIHDEEGYGKNKEVVRVVGDRAWDSQNYINAVKLALEATANR